MLLLIIILILLFGVPTFGYYRGGPAWGGGALGLILVIVLILWLLGQIQFVR
jgi:hypothetical protein